MLELAAFIAGLALCATGLAIGLRARADWAERDQMRRFTEAMRAGGRDHPLPPQRED